MNKDIVNNDAQINYTAKIAEENKLKDIKNEQIKSILNNSILKELDNRHKLKLTNLNHQD